MRVDLRCENDSGAFSLVSADAVPAIVADERGDDAQWRGQALLFELVGDDPIAARLLVDEEPAPEDEAQVLSRVEGHLVLSRGTLLVCGGFDPRCLADWQEGEPTDYVRAVEVPPGTYRVVVGVTAQAMNGRALRAGSIDPATFSTVRIASGAAVLLGLVALREAGRRTLGGSWLSAAMLFLYAVPFSFAYIGLSAGTGALILFGCVQTTMMFVAVSRGDRPHPLQWLGLALAVGGLVYLVLPGLEAPPPARPCHWPEANSRRAR